MTEILLTGNSSLNSINQSGGCLISIFTVHVNKLSINMYSKTCLKRPLKKKTKIGFQDRISLNAGQK